MADHSVSLYKEEKKTLQDMLSQKYNQQCGGVMWPDIKQSQCYHTEQDFPPSACPKALVLSHTSNNSQTIINFFLNKLNISQTLIPGITYTIALINNCLLTTLSIYLHYLFIYLQLMRGKSLSFQSNRKSRSPLCVKALLFMKTY